MTDKERLKEISNLLERYYSTDDSFEQTDLAIEIIQGHVDWLLNRVEELEEQRNERTHLLNAEVARNVRYKKVLDELWKMAKRALEESE